MELNQPTPSQGTSPSPSANNPFAPPTPPASVPPTSEPQTHGGAGAPLPPPPAEGSSARADGAAVTVPPSQPVSLPPTGTPPTPTLTPDTLRSIVEASVRGAMPQQPAAQQPQMTQADFNKHYGLPIVDAAVYESILGTGPDKPERAVALQNLFEQTTRAAVMMARDLHNSELSKLRSELSPIFTAHQAQREQAIAQEFYTSFPEFKGEEALITEIKDAFIARKQNFASKDEAFKAVANQARQIIARFRQPAGATVQPVGNPQKQSGGQTNPPARTMTPSSQGGRGGTGAAASKPIAEQIFG